MTPKGYLLDHEADLVAFLQQLIRFRTVNPPGENYGPCTEFLAKSLAALGFEVRRIEIPRRLQKKVQPDQLAYPRYNVIGFWNAGARKTVHLNAHYDVVPVSGDWRFGDAFTPGVAKGWVYGRGTADMKGAIASIVFACKALRATRTNPGCNVEVSFTADEETDSVLGSNWVVDHGRLRADYAIVGEGGEGDAVCCGHNGVVWLNVNVHGVPAHGSTPEKGVNALEKMSALVLALDRYKQVLARKKFRTPEGKTMHPTLNLGGVFSSGAGGKVNTVPALGSFTVDRRVLPVENLRDAERDLRHALQTAARRIPGCHISVDKISENFSCYSPPSSPFFKAMQESVGRVRRRPSVPTVSTGFNDMHFFAQHLRIPTVGYGPGGFDYHAVDERARARDLVQSAQIYADLLTTFAG
ncbi:MAG TPA: M20 family metallopeptidase [Candidatus Didemnitutus sp.]|jgi:succinyl-diaminopimelate desuccinylase